MAVDITVVEVEVVDGLKKRKEREKVSDRIL